MVKESKVQVVDELKDKIKNNNYIYFLEYQGLNVEQMTGLRALLKENSSELKIYKNTFSLRALHEARQEAGEEVKKILTGSTALIFSTVDPVKPAKILMDFIKQNDAAKMKGALIQNKFLDTASVKTLSTLPSKEVLIAKLLMLMNSPITGFVNVLQGNLRKFVYAVNAVKEAKEKA
ncbi:MAG: 50S ribosomal protein L10 [Candidatus Margulisbacteria bacterium]|nr:50S ribosomal protein L10 [Candidatus Margulisiibacteriota bacterium]